MLCMVCVQYCTVVSNTHKRTDKGNICYNLGLWPKNYISTKNQ